MCAWNPAKVEAMDRSELTRYDRFRDSLKHWIEHEKMREQNGGLAPPNPLMRGDGAYPPEYPEDDPPRWDIPNRQRMTARRSAAPGPGRPNASGHGSVPEPKGPPPAKGCPKKAPPCAPPPFKAAPSQSSSSKPSSSSRPKTPPPPPPWREDQSQGGRKTPPPSQGKGRAHTPPPWAEQGAGRGRAESRGRASSAARGSNRGSRTPRGGERAQSESKPESEAPTVDLEKWKMPKIPPDGYVMKDFMFQSRSGQTCRTRIPVCARSNSTYPPCPDHTPTSSTCTPWEQYMRRMVAALANFVGLRRACFTCEDYLNRDNEDWVSMYASLCDLLELGLNPFMPSPFVAAIGIDPRILDTAGDGVAVKEIASSMRALSIDLGPVAKEDASSEVRRSETFVALDFDLHSGHGSYKSLSLALNAKGWSKTSVTQVAAQRAGHKDFNTAIQTLRKKLSDDPEYGRKVTVHLWLTMRECAVFPLGRPWQGNFPPKPMNAVREEVDRKYLDVIVEIQKNVSRPIIIAITSDPKACNSEGNVSAMASYLVGKAREHGCIAHMDGNMWSRLIAAKAYQSDALSKEASDPSWALLERELLFQKYIAQGTIYIQLAGGMIQNMRDFQTRLEKCALNFGAMPKLMNPTDLFQQTLEANTRIKREGVTLAPGSDAYKAGGWDRQTAALIIPEPDYEYVEHWFTREMHEKAVSSSGATMKGMTCGECALLKPCDSNDERVVERDFKNTGKWCPNCACRHTLKIGGMYQFQQEVNEEAMMGVAVMELWADDPRWSVTAPGKDLMEFMVETMRALIYHPIGKRVSYHGALRLRMEDVIEYNAVHKNTMLDWRRTPATICQRTPAAHGTVIAVKRQTIAYRVTYDPGNATWASYLHALLEPGQMESIFNSSSPSDEILGDGVEAVLGIFMIATRFPLIFERWGQYKDFDAYLRGIEGSFATWAASSNSVLVANYRNRKTIDRDITNDQAMKWIDIAEKFQPRVIEFSDGPSEEEVEQMSKKRKEEERGESSETPRKEAADPSGAAPMDVDAGAEEGESAKFRKICGEALAALRNMKLVAGDSFCVLCGRQGHGQDKCQEKGAKEMQTAMEAFMKNWEGAPRSPSSATNKMGKDSGPSQAEEKGEAGGSHHEAKPEGGTEKATENRSEESSHATARPTAFGPGASARSSTKPSPAASSKGGFERLKNVNKEIQGRVQYDEPTAMTDLALRYKHNHLDVANGSFTLDSGPVSQEAVMEHVASMLATNPAGLPRKANNDPDWHLTPNPHNMYVSMLHKLPEHGDLSVVPDCGTKYAAQSMVGVEPFGLYVCQKDRDWADNQLRYWNTVLRHKIGKIPGVRGADRRIKEPIQCDRGGWVDLVNLAQHDALWGDRLLAEDNWSSTVAKRINLLVQANYIMKRFTKKCRLQFMGVRLTAADQISQEELNELTEGSGMSLEGVLAAPYNGFIKPWCVRATSGHSADDCMLVKIDPCYVACYPTPELCRTLGGAYHLTSSISLKSIATYGLVPGQGSSRLCIHFGCFAPFDGRNRTTKSTCSRDRKQQVLIIHVPCMNLITYGATVSSSGVYMTPKSIPVSEFAEMWLALPDPNVPHQYAWRVKVLAAGLEDEIVQSVAPGGALPPDERIARMLEPLANLEERKDLLLKMRGGTATNDEKACAIKIITQAYRPEDDRIGGVQNKAVPVMP